MSFDDETLMAYADGELAPDLRAQVERAMRDDPQLAAAVERHRALRADVFAAFAGVLDEPVPERLQPRAADSPGRVRVDALASAGARPLPARWSWRQWGGMAASLAAGVLAGALGWQQVQGGGAPFGRQGDALVARGELADALSHQLATDAPAGSVRLGVSFAAKDGQYCRSFKLGATAGLACRAAGEWRIPVLAQEEQTEHAGYRQAASGIPAAVLDAIDERIAGTSLDAAAERAARAGDWQRR
ncbi:anti-sigma factor family protein [Massilia sp. LXY-6]|uniref:anti-sigma factor family protein n=1 Tax=Massilia sp. LXY-6 TaxID=3379823 RepID=UPI003EE2726D